MLSYCAANLHLGAAELHGWPDWWSRSAVDLTYGSRPEADLEIGSCRGTAEAWAAIGSVSSVAPWTAATITLIHTAIGA
jgi:hypothetical protein